MEWRRLAVAVVIAACLAGCAADSSGLGPGPGELTRKVTDPSGDTFGNRGTLWDLTALAVTRDTAGITVTLEFSSDPISPMSGDSNATIGFVDFDTDQDSTTGSRPVIDQFRRDSGSSGIGSDFQLDLADYAADSSVPIFDESGTVTGHVTPRFSGRRITVRIPRTLLGNDDGFLNAAAIVGTTASPDDIIPERGHLQLVPAIPATASSLDRGPASLAPRTGPHLLHTWQPSRHP